MLIAKGGDLPVSMGRDLVRFATLHQNKGNSCDISHGKLH
jgi:hypothetical protein